MQDVNYQSPDFALAGHVIETVITDEFDCFLQCIRNRKCQSYNCQTVGNHGNKTCQLSDHTRHSRPQDLKSTQGFTYYGKGTVKRKTFA